MKDYQAGIQRVVITEGGNTLDYQAGIQKVEITSQEIDNKMKTLTQQLTEIATNVKSFGAKGDGVTNDMEAFRLAYEATPHGGTLFIPQADNFYSWNPSSGHNGSNACLLIDKPITIIADKNALIKFADFADGFMNKVIRRIIRIESDNVTIDGIQLDCNTDNLYLVDGQGNKWWWAEEGDTDILVHRTDVVDIVNPRKNVVIKNSFFYQGHTQIRFSGYDFFTDTFTLSDDNSTRDCVIENNHFERARENVINLSGGSRRVKVHHNKFINCYYHYFRNYYGVENCSFEDNHLYRDLNEMSRWYTQYPNRFYRTNNANHSLYLINRGLIRIGRGNEYSKYIRDITIARNKLEQYMEKEGSSVIHKESNMFANIFTDFNRGGVIIKDNIVIGGTIGIAFNQYIDAQSKTTVIRDNDIRDVPVGILVQYVTTSFDIPVNVKNNTCINVDKPLVLDDTRAFINVDIGRKTVIVAPYNSTSKRMADIVLDGQTDAYILERIFTTMTSINTINLLDGEARLTERIIIRRGIKLQGIENTVIKGISGNSAEAVLSARFDNIELNNISIKKETAINLFGLEIRDAKNVKINGVMVDGFSLNATIRDAENIVFNKCKFSNSSSSDLRAGVDGTLTKNVIVSENMFSGTGANLGAFSSGCLFINNVLNGKTVANTGANNIVTNNIV